MKPHPKAKSAKAPAKAPKLPSQVLKLAAACGATEPAAPSVDAYYDRARKEYLVKNPSGRWLALNEAQFKRRLRWQGFSCSLSDEERAAGATVSEADLEMILVQNTRDVSFAGPLAGKSSGFYEENGERILVTDSPRLLIPQPGDWPLIRVVLRGLVAGPREPEADQQWDILLGWLAAAVQALFQQRYRPSQALVLAGPVGCGKSVLQILIITALLGGRACKCAPYLQGRTNFNGDLFGAEHLLLEDEHADTRISSRLALASNIKQICVNRFQPCQAKHRHGISLSPFWRLTISLNDEPERLLIVPPLAADIADKIIILRCRPFQWPMEIATGEQWERFTAALQAELPAFLHFLLSYSPPAALRSDRYGVASWHHPELVRDLDETAPEAHLALLITRWFGKRETTSWQGAPDQLRTALLNDPATERDARELLHWQNACGTYLGRLESKPRPPLTVKEHRTKHLREWLINLAQT